ncbi:MAG TPA: AAA family ATPase [Bacillota bacterium]|nr:AAA family ATPase [Bacillota bacterium]
MPESSTNLKIAISGDLGSGKSTICKLLQAQMSFSLYSMGEAWRKIAEKYQMTILELNRYSETHPVDEEMDQAMIAMGSTPQNIIFDSRLAWHFIPHAFKIHLIVDSTIAAARIFKDQRGKAEGYSNLAETIEKLQLRKESENKRYFNKYGLDCEQYDNYDLIVDTSYATPEDIVRLIAIKFGSWATGLAPYKLWLSPKSIFPTITFNESEILMAPQTPDPTPGHDFDETKPLSIIRVEGAFYLFGSAPEETRQEHKKVSEALFKSIQFLPARLQGVDCEPIGANVSAQDYVAQNFNLDVIHHWEKLHHFIFAKYPITAP